MGLLDSILGQVGNSLGGAGGASGIGGGAGLGAGGLMAVLGGLLNNPQTGGLSGLVQAFEAQGLGGVMASWVGTGHNLPISAEQLQSVLGSEQMQAMAQQLGLSPDELGGHLAGLLPQAVDHLTPEGRLPEPGSEGDVLGSLAGWVK